MNVAIIDADLIGRKKHRFPNLACMKLSGYHKKLGDHVELLTDWQILGLDKVYVSKVFTDTEVPEEVYDNLIDAVHANLDKMYRYVALRKKRLGLAELHMSDVYTPIVADAAAKLEAPKSGGRSGGVYIDV